jgi:hypothetical protein
MLVGRRVEVMPALRVVPDQAVAGGVIDASLKCVGGGLRRLQAEHISLQTGSAFGDPKLVVLLRPVRPVGVAADRAEPGVVVKIPNFLKLTPDF